MFTDSWFWWFLHRDQKSVIFPWRMNTYYLDHALTTRSFKVSDIKVKKKIHPRVTSDNWYVWRRNTVTPQEKMKFWEGKQVQLHYTHFYILKRKLMTKNHKYTSILVTHHFHTVSYRKTYIPPHLQCNFSPVREDEVRISAGHNHLYSLYTIYNTVQNYIPWSVLVFSSLQKKKRKVSTKNFHSPSVQTTH
jgi:hypothetical protein